MPQSWTDSIAELFRCVKYGTKLERRAAIQWVEDETLKLPQVDQPLNHFFTDGLYWRQIFNPKGCIITTKIHGEHNISVVTEGRIACITEDGMEILESGMMFITKPGTKRVLYAQEDTIFNTIHPNPTDSRDIEELEARIIAPSFEYLENQEAI
jgi:quercetin dioxygenase-like cupin family protein